MADENNEQAAQQPAPSTASAADASIANASLAYAQAAKLAEEQSIDEGEPGGHYLVAGQHVNAYGKPVKQDSKGKWVLVNPDDHKDMGQ